MMKETFLALWRMFVFVALVPVLSVGLVACEPEGGVDGGGTVTPSITPELSVPVGYENYFIEDLSFDRSAGEVKVAFQINVDWTMRVVSADGTSVSWCSVEPASGNAGLHKVLVRVSANDTYEPRSAKIQLLCGTAKVAEIVVAQDYENAVLLSRKDYSVSYEATIIDVELKSNVDFEYEVLNADWVRESTNATRGLSTHYLVFEVDENDSRKEREAHILFYNSEYAVADTLTLVQEGNPNASAYEAIDLGLSVKWASCNVGAESPEDYGSYFAWGETGEKSSYTESTSVTYGLSIDELESRGIIDANGNLTAAYDAAATNWGGSWRMPTKAEQDELCNNCTWSWTTQNGVNGYRVTGPNSNSIFLPAAGFRYYTSLSNEGSGGDYWSATPYSNSYRAYGLYFDSDDYYWSSYERYNGFVVRPVSE